MAVFKRLAEIERLRLDKQLASLGLDKSPTYTIWDRIKWDLERVFSAVKQIRYSLCLMIGWVPVAWRDRDWDYTYIYELLYFKLGRMIDEFEESREERYAHAGVENDITHMKIVRELCRRQFEEDWHDHLTYNQAQKLREGYRHIIFKMMDKHISSWWL